MSAKSESASNEPACSVAFNGTTRRVDVFRRWAIGAREINQLTLTIRLHDFPIEAQANPLQQSPIMHPQHSGHGNSSPLAGCQIGHQNLITFSLFN
jgi:hypothetical protein